MKTRRKDFCTDQSGAVAVIAAIGLFAFLGLAALALDIAHMISVRSELQKAADAGAIAGARGLWTTKSADGSTKLPTIQTLLRPRCAAGEDAVTWATAATTSNRVDGSNLSSSEVAVQVGRWDYINKTFTPGCISTTNAVRVTTTRNGVVMFFATIFGISSQNMQAGSTAVMDFAKGVGKGTLPIVIKKDCIVPGAQLYISMNPDNTDNGGWFVDPPDPANASTFRDYIRNDSCPPLEVGQMINLQNGIDTDALAALKDELDNYHPGGWDVMLPVADTSKFTQQAPIDCFIPFRITDVIFGGDKGVVGTVLENEMMLPTALPGSTIGGTPFFTALALSAPKLVN